jgi:hypothetical protein
MRESDYDEEIRIKKLTEDFNLNAIEQGLPK